MCLQGWADWITFQLESQAADRVASNSILFNTFIFANIFNEINCRRIDDELNVFENLFGSPGMPIILMLTAGLQVLILLPW